MKRYGAGAFLVCFAFCSSACADDVLKVQFDGNKASVSEVTPADSVEVKVDGSMVIVKDLASSRELKVKLSGSSENGQFVLKSATKSHIELDNLKLQSNDGAPITLKTKKKAEIIVPKGSDNSLVVTACKDTANQKAAVIYSKDKLEFSGEGALDVLAKGDGCKGISAKNNITINNLTLNVKTTGDNLGQRTTDNGQPPMGFGGPGMPPPPPNFSFDDMPDSIKQHFEEMRKKFENGEFPPFGGPGMPPPPPGGHHFGGPGEQGEHGGFGGGFMGKQKFMGTCKGIKSTGTVTVNSGNVTVYTTSRGAEGIEGKKGVIINGGMVDVNAMDDAINANAQIYFNGGKTTAISRSNDAVDANVEGGFDFGAFFGGNDEKKKLDPAIIIDGAEVYAYSQIGPPEEGLDCDFAPIAVMNGKAFSIGAGMGEMPSVPTNETAKQPTALLIGLNLVENKDVVVKDAEGKVVMTVTAPFSYRNSSSIITCPDFKKGATYSVESDGYRKTFKLEENFTVVRCE